MRRERGALSQEPIATVLNTAAWATRSTRHALVAARRGQQGTLVLTLPVRLPWGPHARTPRRLNCPLSPVPGPQIIVFFPTEPKPNTQTIQRLVSMMQTNNIFAGIMVSGRSRGGGFRWAQGREPR